MNPVKQIDLYKETKFNFKRLTGPEISPYDNRPMYTLSWGNSAHWEKRYYLTKKDAIKAYREIEKREGRT